MRGVVADGRASDPWWCTRRRSPVAPTARPAATGRLVAQRTLFAGPTLGGPDELYAVVVQGVMVAERDRVVLDGHAVVTTNTYFGRFPASYWQRWTSVALGRRRARSSAATGRPARHGLRQRGRPPHGRHPPGRGRHCRAVRLTVAVDRFVDGGALWLELETATGRS